MSDLTRYKNQRLTLDVTDISNQGYGIAHLADGVTVFIHGAVTGDRVQALVIKCAKTYLVAKAEQLLIPSPYRLAEDKQSCPVASRCGGCIYRAVTLAHENERKQAYVRDAFAKVGLADVQVDKLQWAQPTDGYRNKAQYPIGCKDGKIIAGFYAPKSHTILPVDHCHLQPPVFSSLVQAVCDFCTEHQLSVYDEQSGKGLLRHIYLRIGQNTEQIMVCLVINGSQLPHAEAFCDRVRACSAGVVSILLNHNTKNTNVVLGDTYTTLYGTPYIEDVLCGLRFRIAPDAFYQVNHNGAELLYRIAAQKAALTGEESLIDLYCGIGTIGLSMAHAVRRLSGVEIVPAAVACAKHNAAANGVDNAQFYCTDAGGDLSNVLDEIIQQDGGRPIDVAVIDPPRKGSTPALIDLLSNKDVRRVVYVSCDADTLARDCVQFRDNGYTIGAVTPVNMFPRTGHVESVVCLTKD